MSEIEQQVRMAAALLGVKVEVEKFYRPVCQFSVCLSRETPDLLFTRHTIGGTDASTMTTKLWCWNDALEALMSLKTNKHYVAYQLAKKYKLTP